MGTSASGATGSPVDLACNFVGAYATWFNTKNLSVTKVHVTNHISFVERIGGPRAFGSGGRCIAWSSVNQSLYPKGGPLGHLQMSREWRCCCEVGQSAEEGLDTLDLDCK